MENKKTLEAKIYVRGMDSTVNFKKSPNLVVKQTDNFRKKVCEHYGEHIHYLNEIKIHFPKIIRGTATENIDWILKVLNNPVNWEVNWTCHICKKEFPDMTNSLTKEQMDKIDEKFPWTCPECYKKIKEQE